MKSPLFIILAVISFGFIMGMGDESPLCQIWSDAEQRLKNEDFSITCIKDNDCYGLTCSGATQGYNISSRIKLNACENPPFVEFEVDIPKLNVNNIKKKIYHNDSFPLTKNLNVEFVVQRRKKVLFLGLFVNFHNNGSFPLLRVPMRIPVISNLNFPVTCLLFEETTEQSSTVNRYVSVVTLPTTKSFLILTNGNVNGYSNCSITNSTCSEVEICQQIEKSKPDGICVCMINYTRNEDGKCVLHKPEIDSSSVSLLLTAILVPIFVVLILVVAVYITIRFRVFQHLRRRLRVQVYEHVLLGEDEDEEDMTNPVA